ncbi:MAG: gluconate 2-dehydrogenase subunit 3 family protein [Gemmatimonadaceae bacterium]
MIGARKRAGAEAHASTGLSSGREQPAVLDGALLLALANAVLPQELGKDAIAATARGFAAWLRGYRARAELLHGYGTEKLAYAAESPIARWQKQLHALDEASRAKGGKGFVADSVDERQRVVRAALAGEKLTGFPAPQAASHVALGLMAWYYDSPDATDQCYRADIGKNKCRPLALNPNEPVRLQRGGAAPRGLMPEGSA